MPASGGGEVPVDAWVWILIAVVVVAVIAAIVWATWTKRRTTMLRQQFGPEYDRTIAQSDSRRSAEGELSARRERRAELDIRPLSPAARERYAEAWRNVQAGFVDEPTASLDIGHQQQALELLDALRAESGLTLVAAMHDLTLAAQYADRMLLLDQGRLAADGTPGDVLTEASGRPLRNYLDWEAVKLDLHVGDAVDLSVRSGRREVQRRVVTGDLPTVTAEKYTVLEDLELITVTPAIRAERGIRSEEGVLIFRISPPVSEATGLREGDVILAINRTAVRGASQVGDLLNVRPGEIVRMYLEREGQITFTDLVFR